MTRSARRGLEALSMMAIGDGVLAMVLPRGHPRLWRAGPEPWRRLMVYLENRPLVTAGLGAAEVMLELWLARRATQGVDA